MDISIAVFIPFGNPDAPLSAAGASKFAREILEGFQDRCHAGGLHIELLEAAPAPALTKTLLEDEIEALVYQGRDGWEWHHDGYPYPIGLGGGVLDRGGVAGGDGNDGLLDGRLWLPEALQRRSACARLWRERVTATVAERSPAYVFRATAAARKDLAAAVLAARGIEVAS
jgi:hypothetical protein